MCMNANIRVPFRSSVDKVLDIYIYIYVFIYIQLSMFASSTYVFPLYVCMCVYM